jgi:hypothetical protein
LPGVPPPGGTTRAPQSTVEYQHVWLHYDYMIFPNGITHSAAFSYLNNEPPGFSTAPDPAAIQLVVNAYAAQGIVLHVDPQHTAILGHRVIVPDFPDFPPEDPFCVGTDAVNFSALKAQYFHPTSNHPWHYDVWGYYIAADLERVSQDFGACGSVFVSGFAELPGFNFANGFGFAYDFGDSTGPFFDPYELGGGFMHELGHNLGLHHGGFEDLPNYKPNYISVMNYLDNFGISYGDVHASPPAFFCCRLDYSTFNTTLDQSNLNEFIGVNSGTNDITAFTCGTQSPNGFAGAPFAINSTGPVDWDCDEPVTAGVLNESAPSSGVQASILDLNCLNLSGPQTFDCFYPGIVAGFNDWAYLHQALSVSPDFVSRAHKTLHLDNIPSPCVTRLLAKKRSPCLIGPDGMRSLVERQRDFGGRRL